jgi:sporulation protein YlmC with PRC-barrel domain
MSLPARSLKGVEVIDSDGKIVGSVADVVLNGTTEVEAIVLETPVAFGLSARRERRLIRKIDLLVDPYDRFFLRLDGEARAGSVA